MHAWSKHYDISHAVAYHSWSEPIEGWLLYLKALGRTPETLRTRWYQISRFSRLIGRPIADVVQDDVIRVLAQESIGTESRRGLISCVRAFFDWAIVHNLARENPVRGIPAIPMTRPSGLICPENAITRGITAYDDDTALAVMLAAYCGLRRCEICTIHIRRDIIQNLSGMTIQVHGKGRKERTLPVPGVLAARIESRPKGWLFTGDVNGHAGVDYIGKRIKKATGYPPHSLRRRFATVTYYRSGCNLLLVSKMLGHSNVGTTMHYIGLMQDQMRSAVEAATSTRQEIEIAKSKLHLSQAIVC